MAAALASAARLPKQSPDSPFSQSLRWTLFRFPGWNNTEVMSLVLGTAQWGDAYGVTNARGRLSDSDLRQMVDVARARGIKEVDTARGYGDTEVRLRPFARDFTITTKVSGAGDVMADIQESLRDLDVPSVDSVLVHDWDALTDEQQLAAARALGGAVEGGLATRVGVSIYGVEGIESARSTFESVGVELASLQVPANPIDRRLDDSDALSELKGAGAHITVRSAFLQGVLVAGDGRWSDHPAILAFRDSAVNVGALQACLAHVRGLSWATHVVIGVTSAAELLEVCDAWESSEPGLLPAHLESDDLDLIDPRRW